jgi:aryl-alcohol dehydrogenase-like predicted oxidoreductase
MGRVSSATALRSMNTAFDLGVSHFDIARSYGFGEAEKVVGTFIKGRRDKLTITSKFGIVSSPMGIVKKTLIPMARLASEAMPSLKSSLKRKSGSLLIKRDYGMQYAKSCLDISLKALGTDYIDIYLIHEPEAHELSNVDELSRMLEDSLTQGKIRRWGIACKTPDTYKWANSLGCEVIQFEGNSKTASLCADIWDSPFQKITTRPFAGGEENTHLFNLIQELCLWPKLRGINASILDITLSISRYMAGKSGSVITSMFTTDHINENVQSFSAYSKCSEMEEIVRILIDAINDRTGAHK